MPPGAVKVQLAKKNFVFIPPSPESQHKMSKQKKRKKSDGKKEEALCGHPFIHLHPLRRDVLPLSSLVFFALVVSPSDTVTPWRSYKMDG